MYRGEERLNYIIEALQEAWYLIIGFDRELFNVVSTSLRLSITSTFFASIIGIPAGIFMSRTDFGGKKIVNIILNTLLGLPTVVVGIFVYSLISRRGIMGEYEMLFSFRGIIIGQIILIVPLVTALIRNAIYSLDERLYKTARSLGATKFQQFKLLILEARYGIMGAIITAFGRVLGEVGISMMLGGNIKGVTRTITTAMALETNKGRFGFGLALGLILLLLAFIVNIGVYSLQEGEKYEQR